MGFVDKSNAEWMPVFYNVVHAVGLDCPNFGDDVKLVQYLLKSVYEKQPNYKPKGTMAVDGFCGPVTRNWIQKFQLDCNENGNTAVIVDDRMDRVKSRSLINLYGNKFYSLAVLNYNAMCLNPAAWANTPNVVPMTNSQQVPLPGNDYVPTFQTVPTTGGA